MASRPEDDDYSDIENPEAAPEREGVDDLADGEQAAVETAITRLPPG